MFLPPKHHTIAIATGVAMFVLSFYSTTNAQNSAEFNRRVAAMQQARSRAAQPVDNAPVARIATSPIAQKRAGSNRTIRPVSAQLVELERPVRMTAAPAARRGFLPRHNRMAQAFNSPMVTGGAPLMAGETIVSSGPIMGSPVMDGTVVGSPIIDGQVMAQPYEQGEVISGGTVIGGGCDDGSCGGGCSSCGDSGRFFDDCCGRGGCPPGQPCWLTGLGGIFRNAEYFAGFTSFRSTLFNEPGTANNGLVDDCSHGFYGGMNVGIPLCRLTCGVFSGQFGVRTVNTNFNGNAFTQDDRNQLFITAGFYRRVDYGLQLGVVADILREEWFSSSDTVQIRGDIGYVWPAGTTFGFRFATNVQDDIVSGTFNNVAFNNMAVSTDDNYRFYLRHDAKAGGYGEVFAGWSESDQGIIGLDFDLPITDRVAFEAGFTYYLNDDGVPANSGFLGGNQGEAYNAFVGISLRPRGRASYRSYDRPLFDVADNGTMLMTRN